MKKNSFYIRFGSLLTAATLVFSSCDKGFEDLNTNPDASPTPTAVYMLTKAQLDGASDLAMLLMGTVQYTTSFNNVAGFGSKYIGSQINQTWGLFNTAYTREVNQIGEVIRATEGKPDYVNVLSAARIMRVYIFHRITDVYGAVPYFDAAKGATDAVFKPKYDSQEDIYMDMLNELEEAVAAFDASVVTPTPGLTNTDLFYGGNVDSWKKLGNSLMLRLAMRMTKVNVGLAETWAKKAFASTGVGVIDEDAEITKITYPGSGLDTDKNPLALSLWNSDYQVKNGTTNIEGGKYHEAFIAALKDENDPRLPVLSIVWDGGVPNNDPSLQVGMPPNADGEGALPDPFVTYSEPNPNTVLKLGAPFVLVGNAEINFLLAEAAIRGWYTASSADDLYEAGIRAAMHQLALSGTDGVIDEGDIDDYIDNHALAGTDEDKLNQIYTQFWLGVFPNAVEVYSTWRRTGYPELVPNNFVGNATDGQIFRRFQWPTAEENLNTENYHAAVEAQGGDNDIMTRVWWDSEN